MTVRNDPVAEHFRRSRETLERAADDSGLRATIYTIADAITRTFRNNGKLMIAGNGGSAADAQHIAGEFLSRIESRLEPAAGDRAHRRHVGVDRDWQ